MRKDINFRKYLNNNKNIDVELAICENNKKRPIFQFLNQTKLKASKSLIFRSSKIWKNFLINTLRAKT